MQADAGEFDGVSDGLFEMTAFRQTRPRCPNQLLRMGTKA
jgi:hypothetical protein